MIAREATQLPSVKTVISYWPWLDQFALDRPFVLEQADGHQRHFGNETSNTVLLYVVSIFPFTYNVVHTVHYTAAKLTNNSRIDGD
jgi:hypothetical protein